ncbi:hypothetical protein H072_9422, partial [Dactylellina haptotyla CBS 200.50]
MYVLREFGEPLAGVRVDIWVLHHGSDQVTSGDNFVQVGLLEIGNHDLDVEPFGARVESGD